MKIMAVTVLDGVANHFLLSPIVDETLMIQSWQQVRPFLFSLVLRPLFDAFAISFSSSAKIS